MCREIMDETTDYQKRIVRLAYIALREDCGFDELVPVDDPKMPTEVYNYTLMTPNDKERFYAKMPEFFRNGIGARYYHGIIVARETTRRNFQWLLDMRDIFQAREDAAAIKKVNDRLLKFDVEEIAAAAMSVGGCEYTGV